jgi:hypothetical protein
MTEAERALRERENVAAQRHAGELLDAARLMLRFMFLPGPPADAAGVLRRLVATIEAEART